MALVTSGQPPEPSSRPVAARPAPYVCHLRVLEPLVAFNERTRARWLAALAAGRGADPQAATAAESRAGRSALARMTPTLPDGPEVAVVVVAGVTYACPLRTRWRAAAAATAFSARVPEEVTGCFLPGSILEEAAAEQASVAERQPGLVPHVQTSTWSVPLHWFVVFAQAERQLMLSDPATRVCTYRAPMAQARRRLARALVVVRRSLGEGSVSEALEELGRWLEEFHPRALVELDYGGLAWLLDDESLQADASADDTAAVLGALAVGDESTANRLWTTLAARWREVGLREGQN
jgi:hypothetical protein